MEARRTEDDPKAWAGIRRGWCLGRPEFRRELLEQMKGKLGRHHGGVERQETDAGMASLASLPCMARISAAVIGSSSD